MLLSVDVAPFPLIVEVDVPPKYPVPKTENIVVDALAENCCNALHVFECPRLSVAVSVPDVVTGVPPIVSVEFESESPTDETVALLVLHVPEPVIAPVPLPVRHPVRDVAPVPPEATPRPLVRLSVPIHAVVEVNKVEVALVNVSRPENVLLLASNVVEATTMFDAPVKVTPFIVAPGVRAEAVAAFPDHVPAVESVTAFVAPLHESGDVKVEVAVWRS